MSLSVNITIDVPDLSDGAAFYGALGFTEVARPHPSYAVLAVGEARLSLMEKAPGTRPAPGSEDQRRYDRHWTPVHIDFHVDDFEASLRRAVGAGAIVEQRHDRAGRPPVAFCADPFGHGFCIIGRKQDNGGA